MTYQKYDINEDKTIITVTSFKLIDGAQYRIEASSPYSLEDAEREKHNRSRKMKTVLEDSRVVEPSIHVLRWTENGWKSFFGMEIMNIKKPLYSTRVESSGEMMINRMLAEAERLLVSSGG